MRTVLWVLLFVACGSQTADTTSDAKKSGSNDGSGSDGSGSDGGTSGGNSSTSYSSGTRIKALTTTTTTTSPDGASMTVTQFGGWFDSQRNEACSPALAGDGMTRCLPAAPVSVSPTIYADAACTTSAVLAAACTTAPKYAQLAPLSTSCSSEPIGPTLYEVGASALGYYVQSGSACSGPVTSSSLSVYAAGAVVPASSFAEMTVTTTTN